jgi:SAM-dependent methyltransferase
MMISRLLKFRVLIVAALAWSIGAAAADRPKVPDVVYVPTPYDVVEKMLEMAEVERDDLVYDLGCGDGRIVISAARRFGSRGVGLEIVPELVELSKSNVHAAGVEDLVTIEQKDIYTVDLSQADVLMLYLGWDLNKRLLPQIATLAPGSRIVSHRYGMRGIKPERVVQFVSREDGSERTLFLWRTPLEPEKPKPPADDETSSETAPED